MNKLIIMVILSSLCIPMGCTTTQSGGGISTIEELSQDRYDQVVRYVQIGVNFGIGQLLERNIIQPEDRWVLVTLSNSMRQVANSPASESVGNLLTDAAERIPALQNYAKREYIMAVLTAAENAVINRGGFGVVEQSDGTWRLSDRTRGLLVAISNGIDEAITDDSFVPEDRNARRVTHISPEVNADIAFRYAATQTND